jgi:hypothetical protein
MLGGRKYGFSPARALSRRAALSSSLSSAYKSAAARRLAMLAASNFMTKPLDGKGERV